MYTCARTIFKESPARADGAGGEGGIGGVIIHIQILRQSVGFAEAVHSAGDGVLGTRHLTGDLRNGRMRLQEGSKEIILLVGPERSSLLEHQALLTRDLNGTSGIRSLRHEVCQLRSGKIKRLPHPGIINLGERLTEELLQIDIETGQLARNGYGQHIAENADWGSRIDATADRWPNGEHPRARRT